MTNLRSFALAFMMLVFIGINSPLLAASDGLSEPVTDSVDLIEVNHFYDDQARLVFDQVIYYDWNYQSNKFDIRAWRLLKQPSQEPLKNIRTGEYEAFFWDGDVFRRVVAKQFQETWTQYDPELREREYLPKDRRSELTKPRVSITIEED